MGEAIQVLHVDDEPDFAELAGEFIRRQDERITVETATSAGEGLDLLSRNNFNCIVSDHDMPGKSGIEFLEAVRQVRPEIPFILFTGKGSEEIASRAISAGVTDYLQKEGGSDQYAVLANVIRNLVGKRRAEAESERLRAHQRAITESVGDAIVTIDASSTIIFANQGVQEVFGYSPSEIVGKSLLELMPERYQEGHAKALSGYLDTRERTIDWRNVEFYAVHKEGHEFPVSISFGEFEQDDQQRFVGAIRDISEQRKRTEQLLENERELRLYELVVESSTDLLAAVDGDYTFIFANNRYLDFHALDRDDIGNLVLPDVLGDEWDEGVKEHIDRALAGERIHYEMKRRRADGEVRNFDIRNYPLWDNDGTIIGTVGSMRDITEL